LEDFKIIIHRKTKIKIMRQLSLTIICLLVLGHSAFAGSDDKLSHLRTERKIVTADKPTAPYYAIQILALQLPPQNAEFFGNVTEAREFVCADGYVRYVVGQYKTNAEATADLERVRALGYPDAFVVNTLRLKTGQSEWSNKTLKIDPNKDYTIQLKAFRFPVYISYFKEFDDVMEFYMKDKIFRYTVGNYKGTVILQELARVKALGYPDAFIVDLDTYMPFKIE
jgi:hypothetical protein